MRSHGRTLASLDARSSLATAPVPVSSRVATAVVALAVVFLLGVGVSGCGEADSIDSTSSPATETGAPGSTATLDTSAPASYAVSTEHAANPDAIIAEAAARVEAALGLPAGAVTVVANERMVSDADVVLGWEGDGKSRAWVDLDTGRILAIIPATAGESSGDPLGHPELEETALRVAEQLGWDEATLAAEGFTPEEPRILPHGDAPTEYSQRWAGHDEQGLANQGMIDVALNVTNAELLHFFYNPGPRAGADMAGAIGRQEAIAIAKEHIGDSSQVPLDTTPPGGSAMTTAPLGVLVRSAELVHSDAPGITGGRDMLVWIVKLGGSQSSGEVRATVYVDALTGEVLTWLVG